MESVYTNWYEIKNKLNDNTNTQWAKRKKSHAIRHGFLRQDFLLKLKGNRYGKWYFYRCTPLLAWGHFR